ncbi:PREDICTED: zinc finger BED domain-containing protein 1-like [Amphimedon queenslandica]|uniref:HAT C-terminal dimerisation domain-containing protein n=1 Tax=Amphimedon queenslandica TaxID=400682 RepID=A0A1X7T7M3_AMPQE|nr:PREDICTED: zinc finger BED domain-containing protein 1-like [Amphimedon queenslandica]|eukprot:XP_011408114.1 PREDICTED: zinc finger BED domain-containing protein 1-like [Amphimedon queenslandica]
MITRDIQPVSIVDDIGFLNLLREAKPRYVVPCRSKISRCIDDLYVSNKRRVQGLIADVDFLCYTTDMWTLQCGESYRSLTCHFIAPNYEMHFQNLQTGHFPRTHESSHIAEALLSAAKEWCINIPKQIVTFTTDSGFNIVKDLDDMTIPRLSCAGHTLNLAV